MQKITKDNYNEVFNGLAADLGAIVATDVKDVENAVKKLRALLDEKRKGAEENVKNNSVLQIGIVGQVKAGKSSFLNSLFFDGENVLPRASTPMTAGLTVLEYGEEDVFTVEYYSQTEWNTFVGRAREYDALVADLRQKNPDTPIEALLGDIDEELKTAHELVESCGAAARGKVGNKPENQMFSGVEGLQQTLEKYVGANGAFTSVVKSLSIKLHNEALRDIRIVDTPGVNDPVVSRESRTREFLRACHGVFFLSYSGRFFDATDQEFLSDRIGGNGIGAVVMIASKFDTVLQQVGLDHKDDILGAIAHCQKMLKKQFDTNLAGTSFTGDRPALAFSSGIGYSIAQKSEGQWDDVERNVVSQMKRFFPTYFSSPDYIKAAFTDLAQIEEIRDKYVNGTFAANKDAIMAQKLSGFFSTSTAEMAKEADKGIKTAEGKLEELKQTALADIQKKKDDIDRQSEAIKNNIERVATRLKTKVDTAVKSVMSSLCISAPQLSTTPRSRDFTRLSTFWERNKTFTCSFSLPDAPKTLKDVKSELAKLESVKDEWGKKVAELKKFVVDTLRESVEKAEATERNVDGARLNNAIEEVADTFDNAAVVDFREDVDNVESACDDALQRYSNVPLYQKGVEEEDDAKNEIRENAQACCYNARAAIRDAFSGVRDDVQTELENAGQKFIDNVVSRKQEFIDEITVKLKEKVDDLERELQNKEANIRATESALNGLKSFRAKL